MEIHFAGHSYGSKASLEVIHHFLEEDIFEVPEKGIRINVKEELEQVNYSFGTYFGVAPTIVNIVGSPSGTQIDFIQNTPMLFPFLMMLAHLVVFFTNFFSAETVLEYYLRLRGRSLDKSFLAIAAGLVSARVVKFSFEMGFEEMRLIKEPNKKALHAHDKVVFLLASQDPWVGHENEKRLLDLADEHSNGHVERLHDDVRHAFMAKDLGNEEVAAKILKHLK